MDKEINKDTIKEISSYNWEVSVGVTFASLMGAIALFFTGAVISQYKSFDGTMRIPLLFLIISTFGYIFAASIYSNAGTEITLKKISKVKKYLGFANNIFEFLGLYLLIIATPLVVGSLTDDNFLRISTICISLIGLTLYSSSMFSILHAEVKNPIRKHLLTALIVLMAIFLYISQYFQQFGDFIPYNYVAVALLAVLFTITAIFCRRSERYHEA